MDNRPETKTVLKAELLKETSSIVAAYVGHNPLPAGDLPAMLKSVHSALAGLANSRADATTSPLKPAVPVERSVMPGYIVCLEDGRRLKTLTRHLRLRYGLSPGQYRAKWNLPLDYPMTAPNHAALRSRVAKKSGGRRKRAAIFPLLVALNGRLLTDRFDPT